MKKVVLLINAITTNPTEDELDVLDEANIVEEALMELGYESERLFMGLNMDETSEQLLLKKPSFVFNLVESLDKDGKLIYFAPSLLEHLKIPFTGCRSESTYITSNKTLTKKMLFAAGLPTPRQICDITTEKFNPSIKYLRYKDESDSIAFSALELFAMESWTQQAFNKSKFLYMQITAATFIFA